jgi:uncharacterized protein (TIRG00374 family)
MIKFQRKNKITIVLGILTSGLFGYFALKSFNWQILKEAVLNLKLFPFLLTCLFFLIAYHLRAVRWKTFLPKHEKFSYSSRFSGVILGYFFNGLLPLRIGDLIRPVYLAKANQQPLKICFFSVVLEKIFDIVILLVVALTVITFVSIPQIDILSINIPLMLLGTVAGIVFLLFTRPILTALLKILSKFKLEFFARKLREIMEAFKINFKFAHTLYLIVFALLIVFVEGLTYVFLLDSLSIEVPLLGAFLVMIITTISFLLPSAPASVGVFHYFCQLGLVAFGVNSELALSGAIVIHATLFGIDYILGFLCLFWGPLKLMDLFRSKEIQDQGINQLKDDGESGFVYSEKVDLA